MEENIKSINLNTMRIKKSDKKINRLERLFTLFVLTMSYDHFSKAIFYSKCASYKNSYQEAESLSVFINTFFMENSQPSDFIHNESDMVNEALLNYDKYKEWLNIAENSGILTVKQAEAFCRAIEHDNVGVILKSQQLINYARYFYILIQYVRGDIPKNQLIESFVEYSIFTGQKERPNLTIFRKIIQKLEAIYNEICYKQSIREIRKSNNYGKKIT